jgi:hypothetical protein
LEKEKYHVVHINTLTIGPLAASRRTAVTSQDDTKNSPQEHIPENVIPFTPSNTLTCYNWQTTGQVIFHLISHPEEREELKHKAKQQEQIHQTMQIYHPLLPKGILIYPNISDIVLLRILHGVLWRMEGLWLIIPELEFHAPGPPSTSYWAYRKL